MLQVAQNFALSMMKRWSPDTFVSRKLNQADDEVVCGYSFHPMEGTVAVCERKGETVVKRLRPDLAESDRRELALVVKMMGEGSTVGSWAADAMRYEHDLVHEARMQQLFCDAWASDFYIHVPVVLPSSSSATQLVSQYFAWPRLLDFPPECPSRSAALRSVARFFFESLRDKGLLHGDISETNVLVNPHMPQQVCVLDFGLSKRVSTEETKALLEVRPDSAASVEVLGRWKRPEADWSPTAWQEVVLPAALLGQGEGPEHCKNGCFVRSLTSLTRMACSANMGKCRVYRL